VRICGSRGRATTLGHPARPGAEETGAFVTGDGKRRPYDFGLPWPNGRTRLSTWDRPWVAALARRIRLCPP
ncbi:MAG: hypothetical protein OXH09_05340, partial [Gammaproteobacteria bacterium]|nr:hypothetical protein [Gammaproteobacteria bacterium]